MFAALKRLFAKEEDAVLHDSKQVAKSRLSFVLVQDRTGLSKEQMSSFKRELVEVINRYFVTDETGFDINYQRDNDTTTLLINSPIIVRRQKAAPAAAQAPAPGAPPADVAHGS